ncbi:ABC transporter permease, partial [Micromonospora sp. NPDC048843]
MNIAAAPGPGLVTLCVVLVAASAAVYRFAQLGPVRVVPAAATRAILQLGMVAAVLGAALTRLWSSFLVLAVMFAAAVHTAGRRASAGRSGVWLAVALATGWIVVLAMMIGTGVVPMKGVAI